MYTQITEHEVQALARLVEQFKSKTNLRKLVGTLAGRAQGVEDVLYAIEVQTILDNATDAQLDMLGRIVGEPRGTSADDAEYRQRIQARIRLNQSSGTTKDIYAVFRLLLPNAALVLTEFFPAGFVLDVDQVSPVDVPLYSGFLKQAKSGGVGAQLKYKLTGADTAFTCALATMMSAWRDSDGPQDIPVYSTEGFPENGSITIISGDGAGANTETVTYTSKTPAAFLGVTNNTEHDVHSVVAYNSSTSRGFGSTLAVMGGKLVGVQNAA